jgi:hypothetical protein
MNDKASRILYFLLFILGWIGIFWTVYAFFLNAYNGTMEIITENPSFFTLLCISLMSIATAFILEKVAQIKQQ